MMKSNGDNMTIEDVAVEAKVSRSTVGRVIGNYGSVSENSRKRVQAAIEKLHYSPNAVAQSLRNRRTNTIAVVVGSVSNRFFSKVIGAIENEVANSGYSLLICSTNEDLKTEVRHLRSLLSRRVDAVILSSLQESIPPSELGLYNSEIPIIYIDSAIPNVCHDLIESANYEGTYEATEYLLSLGHRKIGVLMTSLFPTVRQRVEGYRGALAAHGMPCDEKLIVDQQPWMKNLGRQMLQELLVLNDEVTAILILNNNLCDDVLLGLRDLKKRIPDDISLMTWDDTAMNDLLGITTIAQFPELIGKTAAIQAIRRSQESNNSKQKEQNLYIRTLKTELRIRTSCKALQPKV
ncbi:MAG: LacI family transcriptional regulator [Synergistaceae bacterium]|jgi:LacI family transcriptional regulator|nr:LacI family transcriptional regulator [Synergistaceae bacterium]